MALTADTWWTCDDSINRGVADEVMKKMYLKNKITEMILNAYSNMTKLKKQVSYFRAVWIPCTLNHNALTHSFPTENTGTC